MMMTEPTPQFSKFFLLSINNIFLICDSSHYVCDLHHTLYILLLPIFFNIQKDIKYKYISDKQA